MLATAAQIPDGHCAANQANRGGTKGRRFQHVSTPLTSLTRPEPTRKLSYTAVPVQRFAAKALPQPPAIDDDVNDSPACHPLVPDEPWSRTDEPGKRREPSLALVESRAGALGHRRLDSLPRPTTDGAERQRGGQFSRTSRQSDQLGWFATRSVYGRRIGGGADRWHNAWMAYALLRLCAIAGLANLLACSSSSSTPSSATDGGSDGGTVTVSASGYDVSCQKDADCVLVETGSWSATDPCCGHGCPSAAINIADQSKYQAAAMMAEMRCMPPGASACGVECATNTAFCNAGTCDTCTGTSCATARDAAAE
jgi:hypothetical protein